VCAATAATTAMVSATSDDCRKYARSFPLSQAANSAWRRLISAISPAADGRNQEGSFI
jgi:hypothetical protein